MQIVLQLFFPFISLFFSFFFGKSALCGRFQMPVSAYAASDENVEAVSNNAGYSFSHRVIYLLSASSIK